jgi:hypothetical protein
MTRLMPLGGSVVGKLPKEGSTLRKYYDLFVANPGKPVTFSSSDNTRSNVLRQLGDYYGLVIKKTACREERVLVGQYIGADYVEYACDEKATG